MNYLGGGKRGGGVATLSLDEDSSSFLECQRG